MRGKLRVIVALFVLAAVLVPTPALAATGDADTFFNLEANTASVNNYGITAGESTTHFTDAFTFEMWINPSNICSTWYCHIIAKEGEYVLGIVNGTYQYALNGTGGGWAWVDTTVVPRLNTWQHVALTRASGTNSVSLYLNGLLLYTGPADHLSTGSFYNANYNFEVGARTSDTNNLNAAASSSFIGDIDEVKLWQTQRTATQIQSDMSTYGPINDSNLKVYFDFNDQSGNTIVNKASAAPAGSALTIKGTTQFTALETSTLTGANKIVKFPRTYLSANGWKPPSGISSVSALVVGGGGGGGNNVGNGGSGGGGYSVANIPANSNTSLAIKVGFGGNGGRYIIAGTLTYDGTSLMNGQNGDSSSLIANGSTFTGGGGGGGLTTWSNNLCGGAGENIVSSVPGVGSGTGGTALTGGGGGIRSTTQSVANGSSGFTSSITGSSAYYGSGGGAGGGWSNYLNGYGANSQGGNSGALSAPYSGANGTGSGGGGNVAGCALGGYGGSGIVILSFNAFTGGLSLPSTPVFRAVSPIVATVTYPGLVTFFAQGKAIPGCVKVPTVSSTTITATCNWKPSQHSDVTLTAKLTPTASPSSVTSMSAGSVRPAARSGNR